MEKYTKSTYDIIEKILHERGIQNLQNFENEINSLDFIEIIAEIEKKFDIEIEIQMLEISKMNSITLICEYITSKVDTV